MHLQPHCLIKSQMYLHNESIAHSDRDLKRYVLERVGRFNSPVRKIQEFVAGEWTVPAHHPSCLLSIPVFPQASQKARTKIHIAVDPLR